LALVGAVGKAVSFVFSSQGVAGDFEPLAASFIRLLIGTCAIWIFALVSGQIKGTVANLRDHPTAFRHLSIGAVSGPVIGASMVLLALQRAPVGIASTLANLAPIFLIPVGFIVFKEKITRRAIVGTLVAMTGIAILFL
jgi:drug/metabolite transporter (DMT)-like permease